MESILGIFLIVASLAVTLPLLKLLGKRPLQRRRDLLCAGLIAPVLISCGLSCGFGSYMLWASWRPQPADTYRALTSGVSYSRQSRQYPRPIVLHVIQVDLRTPGLRIMVTPRDVVAEEPMRARTVKRFLNEFDMSVAINGNAFYPFHSRHALNYYPRSGGPVKVLGYAASRGTTYGTPKRRYPSIYFGANHRASFTQPSSGIYNVISGFDMIAKAGAPIRTSGNSLHPRTGIAIDKTGDTLLLMVVDGRQAGYSEGVSLSELADLMIEFGAHTAMNLDGGGSSTLAAREHGSAHVLNSPIHARIAGLSRPVANHLGIYVPSKPARLTPLTAVVR
jgi:hypothetical protein